MKTLIKIFSLIFLSSVVFYSCNDADLDVVDSAAGYSEGGLVRNDTKSANFVIGSDQTYTFEMLIYQGAIKTTGMNIMKTFTTATGLTSNTILLKNVEVTSPDTESFSFSTTYAELIEGLEIGGVPLPENDSDLAIGDYWTLTYVAVTSEGKEHANGATSKLGVSTRLAGVYTLVESGYIRIDVDRGSYNGTQRTIESVANEADFATYKATDIGWWEDDLMFYYFYVSNTADADGSFPITIPVEYNGAVQLFGSAESPIMVCQLNELPDMPCTNYVKLHDDGRDEYFLSFGYFTASGDENEGPRQFYEHNFKN